MSAKKKHVPTLVKVIAAIMTPIIIAVASFYFYGRHIINEDAIFQNITVAGVDVSGLTRSEAMSSLELPTHETRSTNAIVTISFPDDSELNITGNDVRLHNNAEDIVSGAHSIGRGHGLIIDTISYMARYTAEEISFDIDFVLDEEVLRSIITEYTNRYNQQLEASIPEILDDRIIFTKGNGHVSANADEIYELAYNGIFESFYDETPVEIVYSLPETSIFIDEILEARSKIFVPMMSSEYDPVTKSATESIIGVDIDLIESARLVSSIDTGQTVVFPFVYTYPEYSQELLESLLFRDLIGTTLTTYVHGSSNRLNNVELSSGFINGTILLPGEEFSFNGIVGPRSSSRGFRSAPMFVGAESVPALGGGICQTSSTIYAAIRLTELQITERRQHSRPVPYLPRGHCAAIVWGALDFRFINNTNYPLRIDIVLDEDRYLTAEVWGTIIDDFPWVPVVVEN